ncbi:hypothetical protein KY317_02685 [Candidatus Woesearchaeota archaeon]|nr:hypothetical protein [Candidatus Woesearchaeota archaeon]
MAEIQKRQIAYKARIADIINGTYVKEEGWTPNYIKINERKISRINVIGIILSVENDENLNSAVIDDGSGTISIRSFEKENPFTNFSIGDIVLVIGRPREYSSERYVLVEIIKKTSPEWLKLRSLELKTPVKIQEPPKPPVPAKKEGIVEEEIITEESTPDNLLEYIKNNDKGDGVPFVELIKIAKEENAIEHLLKEGEIFEIKPGFFKVLQ